MLVKLSSVSLSVFFVLSISIAVFAQLQTGEITIVVMDANGNVVENAAISVSPGIRTSGVIRAVSTNASGEAIVFGLAPGNYEIKVAASGSGDITESLTATSGKMKRLTIRLPGKNPGPTRKKDFYFEQSAFHPLGLSVTEELRYPGYARIQPTTGISIDGSTESDNVYFVDGQQVGNVVRGNLNRTFDLPLELLSEVRTTTPDFGRANQGTIGSYLSFTTRGGNNDWHGEAGLTFIPSALNFGNRAVLNRFGAGAGEVESFQPKKDDSNGFVPVMLLSGPVVKDRIWFLGSYTPRIYDLNRTIDYFDSPDPLTRTVIDSVVYGATRKQEFAFGRFDFAASKNLTGAISFLWNPTIGDGILPDAGSGLTGVPPSGGFGTAASFAADRGGRFNSNLFSARLNWVPAKRFHTEFRFGRTFANDKLGSYGIDGSTRYFCSTSGTPQNVPGSNCLPGFDTGVNSLKKSDAQVSTSIGADGGIAGISLIGKHHLRFGYQYDRFKANIDDGYADTGLIALYYGVPISTLIGLTPTEGNLGSGFLQRFGNVGDAVSSNQSAYAGTDWRITPRLTTRIGLRIEKEDGGRYLGPADDSNPNSFVPIRFGWGDKLSPQIGFAADVFGNGKTLVRGAWSRSYDRLKNQIAENLTSELFVRDYFEILPQRGASYDSYTYANILGGDTSFAPQCPRTGPGYSVCRFGFLTIGFPEPFDPLPIVDPELKATFQDFFFGSINQEIAFGLELSGSFVHTDLRNPIEDVGVFNDQGSEAYAYSNPGRGLFCEIGLTSGFPCQSAKRRYDALEMHLSRWSKDFRYYFNLGYIRSKLRGNYSGLTASDEGGRLSPNASRTFDLPSSGFDADGSPDFGPLPGDRPNIFNFSGSYRFDWGRSGETMLTGFTTYRSGTPLTTFYNLYQIQTSVLYGRGDLGRTEPFTETSLGLTHRIGFGRDKAYSLSFSANVFNLFDEKSELNRQTQISSTNFTSTALTSAGCTTCQIQPGVYDTIFNNGGISQFVTNYLNTRGTSTTGFRNDYNLPNLYQDPRSVRFSVKLLF
ncbi:MAG: carboxypeptidase-like regulatory domain-containing protein [Pyrinomonadaceae bacterium]